MLDCCKTYWTFNYDKQATLFGYSKYGRTSKTTARNSQTVTAGVLPRALTRCWFCSYLLTLNSTSVMRWHQQNTLEMCTKSSWSPSWLRFLWDLVCCSCYCGLASMYEGTLKSWSLALISTWTLALVNHISPFFLVVLAVERSHSIGTRNRHKAQAGWDWTALTLWDHMDSGCLFTSKEDLYNLCCLFVNLSFSGCLLNAYYCFNRRLQVNCISVSRGFEIRRIFWGCGLFMVWFLYFFYEWHLKPQSLINLHGKNRAVGFT